MAVVLFGVELVERAIARIILGMENTVKVVKKSIKGWLSPNLEESVIAEEIQNGEVDGWKLATVFGASLTTKGTTDTLVFIFRK